MSNKQTIELILKTSGFKMEKFGLFKNGGCEFEAHRKGAFQFKVATDSIEDALRKTLEGIYHTQNVMFGVSNEAQNTASCQTAFSGCRSFRLGDIVYHRSIYEHKEPLKVVGIAEDKLLLEGDFSGGTHNVVQRGWLPIKGTSRVYNYAFKVKARHDVFIIKASLNNQQEASQGPTYNIMMDLIHSVMALTSDVVINPEF